MIKASIPYLLNTVLFPREVITSEMVSVVEHRLALAVEVFSVCKNYLTPDDLLYFVNVFCFYFGSPLITYRYVKRLASVLSEMISLLRKSFGENKEMMSRIA